MRERENTHASVLAFCTSSLANVDTQAREPKIPARRHYSVPTLFCSCRSPARHVILRRSVEIERESTETEI